MEKIVSFAFVLFLSFFGFSNDKEIVKGVVTDVTVFAQGAQLFQKASYNVKAGISEIVMEGISPYIDANSLQVKASGNIIILDSKYSLYYPKPEAQNLEGLPLKIRKEIQFIEDSIRTINYDIQEIQDEIDVLNSTKSILTNNGAIRGQGKVNDSINLLKQAVEYYSAKMLEINRKLLALNKRKNEKNEKKRQMDERLSNLKNYQSNNNLLPVNQGPIHRIIVTVSAKELVAGKLTVSYLVSNAGWIPFYDLRSDGLTSKINLTYKAQVYQNTGLDWENVKLNISTNNPYQNKTKPSLYPWYIDYYSQGSYKTIQSKSLEDKKRKDEEVSYGYVNSINETSNKTSAEFVNSVKQLTSVEFRIDLPYSIKSDNEKHLVLIKMVDMDASYKYFSVPKIDPSVFLVAQLTNLDELGLVPAEANLFFDGSFIGETYIDPTSMNDTLDLSLGKDPNLIIKRTLLKKDSKEKIIGDKKERTMSYNIEVKNLKVTDVELTIQDQLPITQNGEIMIESTELDGGKLNELTGIIDWTFKLKSKDSKQIKFGFKVKHNKDLNIQL